jgi:Tol biopolymer transport system component
MKIFAFFLLMFSAAAFSQQLNTTSPPNVRFITSQPGALDEWPCFSPDGKSVLFSRSEDKGKTWIFYIAPTAGGEATRFIRSPLPLPVSATRAVWSTRSNEIAFTGVSTDGVGSLWLVDAQGTQPRPLTSALSATQIFYPSWYPDGRRLLVMDAKNLALKVVDPASSTMETITDRNKVFTGMPSVSPDGSSIAFAGQINDGHPYDQNKNSIWLIKNQEEPRLLEHETLQGRAPTWSPDGKRIVFESNRASGRSYSIFVARADGTGIKQLTDGSLNATHPVWSPTSKQIVFSARQPNGQIGTGVAVTDALP